MSIVATGSSAPRLGATEPNRERDGRSDWKRIVVVFWITSMIEGLGVAQVFSFLAPYLREVGVPEADRAPFVGLFSALVFVVGMPLVPLWGVWADKYSRKAVIVRSCLVEAVVFVCGPVDPKSARAGLDLLENTRSARKLDLPALRKTEAYKAMYNSEANRLLSLPAKERLAACKSAW